MVKSTTPGSKTQTPPQRVIHAPTDPGVVHMCAHCGELFHCSVDSVRCEMSHHTIEILSLLATATDKLHAAIRIMKKGDVCAS